MDTYKKENDIINKMAKDYAKKESKMNDKIKEMDNKIKF